VLAIFFQQPEAPDHRRVDAASAALLKSDFDASMASL
jgi:hypothetical protein